jgi:transposase InsO family protein
MDLYSRRIIGWSFGNNRKAQLTTRALSHAIRKRYPPKGMMFHSDRGIEYRCNQYSEMLERHSIKHSVNRPGFCQDNAHMESFFHTLKGELKRKRSISNERELKQLVKGHIVHFYIKNVYTRLLTTVVRLNLSG